MTPLLLRCAGVAVSGWMLAGACGLAMAQQPMGSVPVADASVSGQMLVHEQSATLLSNTSVTAYGHTAEIHLARGGKLLVCETSQLHLLHAGQGKGLLVGLDRGALELATNAEMQDILLTPDIRFTLATPGRFDLRMRVTREGDTCVENRGKDAPVLMLSSAFGTTSYRLLPNQHVMFEHGNLGEVVDNERSACGCPVAAPSKHLAANATDSERLAAEHPFPEAASQDLTSSPNPPKPYSNAPSTAILSYNSNDAAMSPVVIASATTPSTVKPVQKHGFFQSVGSFFARLFGN
ncbi:MAG: nuclease [Acidobacteriaceae bacterium]|nr:nuclease [Acidobacteriaceae bacterium]